MISASELRKSYGQTLAVRGVSFQAERGSVLGLLGPNGAGKTSIMKVLTGYHYPDSGTALVCGIDVTEDPVAVKAKVGYLPESAPLYPDLTPAEYLDFAAEARGLAGAARSSAVERAVESCGLAPVFRRPVEELSKGYRQRLGLAQAILHDPEVLILDEPTTGLDPNQILEIRALIREIGREKTVLLSTHVLQEVEAVCSRVVILNDGLVAAMGAPSDIGEALKGEERLRVRLRPRAGSLDETRAAALAVGLSGLRGLRALDDPRLAGDGSCALELAAPAGGEPGALVFDWAVENGLVLLELERHRLSLEEIFVKLTAEGGSK
ncbi:MAG: ATP-binding cassette domain-containing protein [Spirochaetaceae bacterium]|nr:ATP-binding cassette domain-containing protein [Spirochaetaceae bacterium]